MVISIVQLEAAINRALVRHPPANYVLHADLRALAEIYARMIMQKAAEAELDKVPGLIRAVVLRWLDPAVAEPDLEQPLAQPACPLRLVGADFESPCDACQ